MNQVELEAKFSKDLHVTRVWGEFVRPLAGGQPFGEKDLRAYVEFQMHLAPDTPEFEAAVRRIKNEEVGEHDITPENGELNAKRVYSLKVIRSDDFGPFLLNHQIKACLKQAASRCGLFKDRRGAKGDLSELGQITARDSSLRDIDNPYKIYLYAGLGAERVKTYYEDVLGCVSGPSGTRSIVTTTQFAPVGSKFSFEITWPRWGKFSTQDMERTIWAMTRCGLGSTRSMDYGQWAVTELAHAA